MEIDVAVAAVEGKLDDETRFTDDAEAAALEANLTAEINANESLLIDLDADVAAVEGKLDSLDTDLGSVEAKLDDETRFTDDAEAAALEASLTARSMPTRPPSRRSRASWTTRRATRATPRRPLSRRT